MNELILTLDAPGASEALGKCYALLARWAQDAQDAQKERKQSAAHSLGQTQETTEDKDAAQPIEAES